MRYWTSGAGRVVTPTNWPAGGIATHGIDISETFVDIANRGRAAG
ncbi:MAG: hypothetical protein R2694_15250 [Ilumatobacteraceae bacterium]